jgi:type II secretory pathway pseudopilin PulG
MKMGRSWARRNLPEGWVAMNLIFFAGVLSLLGALLLPVWQRSTLRELAETLRGDLVVIEKAVAEAAIKGDADAEEALSFDEYGTYLHDREALKRTGLDPFGEAYGDQYVDEVPVVPVAAYEQLRSVVPDSFWKPFQVPRRDKDAEE